MFKENLRAARQAKGITQEYLAMRLNVVRQTISKWEKGLSVPDADLLIRLSDELGVTVSELLDEKTDFEQDTDTVAEQLSHINEQLADRIRRTRRFTKIILTVICAIFCFTVIFILVQAVTGTAIREEITVTAGEPTVVFDE